MGGSHFPHQPLLSTKHLQQCSSVHQNHRRYSWLTSAHQTKQAAWSAPRGTAPPYFISAQDSEPPTGSGGGSNMMRHACKTALMCISLYQLNAAAKRWTLMRAVIADTLLQWYVWQGERERGRERDTHTIPSCIVFHSQSPKIDVT